MKTLRHPLYLFQLVVLVALAGCPQNPLRYAETTLDKAHVALRSVEIVQQEILGLVSDPAVQLGIKGHLKSVSHDAALAAEQLGDAVVEFEDASAALAGAETTSERLLVANANLVAWTNTLNARIASAKAALKEIKTP